MESNYSCKSIKPIGNRLSSWLYGSAKNTTQILLCAFLAVLESLRPSARWCLIENILSDISHFPVDTMHCGWLVTKCIRELWEVGTTSKVWTCHFQRWHFQLRKLSLSTILASSFSPLCLQLKAKQEFSQVTNIMIRNVILNFNQC